MFHRRLSGAAVVAVAFTLTACADADGEPAAEPSATVMTEAASDPMSDPRAYFAAINDAATEAGSFRLDMTSSEGGAAEPLIEMSGVVADVTTGLMEVTISMSAAMLTGEDADGAPPVEVAVVETSDTAFFQYPPELGLNGPGEWLAVDPASRLGRQMMGGVSTDVVNTVLLEILAREADVSVTVGEPIDGVATDVVRMVVDAEQYFAAVLGDEMSEDTSAAPFDEIEYVLTVGDDLLIREATVSLGDFMSIEVTMSDYGAEYVVETPPEEDTMPLEDLIPPEGLAG